MKIICQFALLLIVCIPCFAQDFSYGQVYNEELTLKNYELDTTANALVLSESGDSRILGEDRTPLQFTYHVKIKLFNSRGFGQANIVIPLYIENGSLRVTVDEIKGYTASLKDGRIIRTDLDPKKIYREKQDENMELIKFTMPNLTEGCVIEYTYRLKTPFITYFRTWRFQSDIPKLKSVYVAHIPAIYNYNVTLRGPLALSASSGELERECLNMGGGFIADCSRMTYAMENVPALVEEEYMTSRDNYLATVAFELSDYKDRSGATHKVSKEWKDIDLDMKNEPGFGGQLKKGDVFNPQLAAVITDAGKDSLTVAKAIFAFIKKSVKWNGSYNYYSENGIKKAFDNRSGSIGDVNLSLTAALSEAGLDAEAVLLSTRENGLINRIYPGVRDFDYVISKVNIGGQSYLLDASEPLLPFGLIPVRCINDQGRVISRNKPSYWIDLKASQKESRVVNLDLTLKETGKITGTLICYSRGYEAFNKRSAINKFASAAEYAGDLDEKLPGVKIVRSEIRNIDSLENTLVETYQLEIETYNNLDKESFLFNPFFIAPVKQNPFKLRTRSYPVDWGVPSDYKVTLALTVPDGFNIVAQPAAAGIALPLNGGRYITNSTITGNRFTLSEMILLDKPVYSPEEYPFLKEFFNRIVQTQKTDLIFRKQP